MQNTTRSKAEQQFAAAQKKASQALSDREKARQKDAEHTAKLRDLRLAKESADAEAAAEAEKAAVAAKAAAKKAPAKARKAAAAKKSA